MISIFYKKKLTVCFLTVALFLGTATVYANKTAEYKAYCSGAGGTVEEMSAEISTGSGLVKGPSRLFCNFNLDSGFLLIGLETFSAGEPSIAATYLKSLGEIASESLLWKGKYSNPSSNVCKNLGGATIGFVAGGGFANHLGQSDICVFGDGSMVSGWSLIYMAGGRAGYNDIKNKIKAEALNIYIPN